MKVVTGPAPAPAPRHMQSRVSVAGWLSEPGPDIVRLSTDIGAFSHETYVIISGNLRSMSAVNGRSQLLRDRRYSTA